MKKILVSCLAAGAMVSASSAFAMDAGTIMVTGGTTGGFLSKTTKDDTAGAVEVKESAFGLSTGVGYFVIPNLAVGLGVGYGSGTKESGGQKGEMSGYDFGPFAQYMVELNPQMHAYGKVSFMMGSEEEKFTGTVTHKGSSTTIGLGGGVAYMLTKSVSADVELGYNILSSESEDMNFGTGVMDPKVKNTGGEFGIGVGLTVFIGK